MPHNLCVDSAAGLGLGVLALAMSKPSGQSGLNAKVANGFQMVSVAGLLGLSGLEKSEGETARSSWLPACGPITIPAEICRDEKSNRAILPMSQRISQQNIALSCTLRVMLMAWSHMVTYW